jgi:methyl-accepting chemotaxis protein
MAKWTIGKRLVVGFAAVVVVMIALGGFAISRVLAIKGDADRVVNDSLPGTALSGELGAAVKDNYALVLKGVHADSPAAMQKIDADTVKGLAAIVADLASYEKTITQPDDRKNFDAVKPAREAFLQAKTAVMVARKEKGEKEAVIVFAQQLEPAYVAYDAAIDTVREWNNTAGAAVGQSIAGKVSSTVIGVSTGLVVGTILAALLAFIIVRSTSKALSTAVNELREGSEQVVSASSQVSMSAQSLSQGATEQAASLEETSASMEEMASMTRKNAENAQRAAALVTDVATQVDESNAALTDMVASMASIKESSNKVAKIIKTIDEIAFQTNILALNAAVEAARAGEAGMGFAVVADEVRNLAQRSAQAAKDTAVLIEESITRSNEGAGKVEQVAKAIGTITGSVAQVKGIVQEVREASQQQTQGIDQVSQAIAQMEKVTQTTAATAEESAAASEELNAQAEASMHIVRGLEQMIGGAGASEGTTSPAPMRAPIKDTRRVVPMPQRPVAKRTFTPPSPQDDIPMGDTGTFGKF